MQGVIQNLGKNTEKDITFSVPFKTTENGKTMKVRV